MTTGLQIASAQQTPENGTATDGRTDTATGTETETPSETEGGIETRALVIPPEGWERSLEGYFIHAAGEVDPLPAAGSDKCDYATWPDSESRAYDVTLVEPGESPQSTEGTTLYVENTVDIPSGGLFVIERIEECPSSYRGVFIRQIGVRDLPSGGQENTPDDETGDDENSSAGAFGPGFGVLTALAGIAGGAGLARLRRSNSGH